MREGQWEDTVPLPSITKIEEIPPEDTEYILHRMELGGYGTQENILRCERDRLLKLIKTCSIAFPEATVTVVCSEPTLSDMHGLG